MKLKHLLLTTVATFSLVGVLAGCSGQSQGKSTDSKIQVVASVDFYGEAAKTVLGNHGTVTSIINSPNIDPHDYEPTTSAGKKVAQADVAIANGVGYDAWMNKLVKTSDTTTLIQASKIVGVKDGENEHIWYKPQAMPKMANAYAKKFGQIDPTHKADYQANAKKYIQSLQPLMKLINQLKNNANGKEVAISEPVFQNALHYLGYKVVDNHFAMAIEEGTDPSAQDIKELTQKIQDKQIAFFVQNTQVNSPLVKNMVAKCKAANIPVLKVTETLPADKNYVTWMTSQYKQLEKIQNEAQ